MKNAIESCSNENSSECQNVKKTYGDTINAWCFSDSLVDMSGLFKRNSQFNEDISRWDVSKVTNMAEMFHSATSFNRNIRDWDVSEVRNMNSMFYGATAFEGTGIGNWKEKTSNVLIMSRMFQGASSFDQDIGGWDVGKVRDMIDMFHGATAFNGNIGDWREKTRNVQNMYFMFYGATTFDQDISGWDISKVRDMSAMFQGATSFNQDIGGWDVSEITNMNDMFRGATSFDQDISGWTVDKVTSMNDMFHGATSFDKDISGWDISKVSNMKSMFEGASKFNQNLCKWNVPNQFPYGNGCNQMFKDSGCEVKGEPFSRFYPLFCSPCTDYPGLAVNPLKSVSGNAGSQEGQYFGINSLSAWTEFFGSGTPNTANGLTVKVKQCKNGIKKWSGWVRFWKKKEGRRDPYSGKNNWEANDRVVKYDQGCSWDSYDSQFPRAYKSSQVHSEMNVGSALQQGAFGDENERSDANKEFIIHENNDPAAAHHSLANDDGKDLSLEMEPIDHHEHNNPHLSSVSSFDDVIYFYSGSKLHSTNTYRFVTILLSTVNFYFCRMEPPKLTPYII